MGDWSNFFIDLLIQAFTLFINPVLYVFALLLYWHYHRQIVQERKLFHVRLTSAPGELLGSLVFGAMAGIGISIALLLFGVAVSYHELLLLWGLSVLLSLVHIRFLSFTYSGGLLVVFSLLARLLSAEDAGSGVGQLITWLQEVNIPSVLALVAALHIAEGILLRVTPNQGLSPLFIKSERGRIVGAYAIQKFWLVPLVMFVTGEPSGEYLPASPSWWPWFYAGVAALSLLPVPAVTGYADLAVFSTPQERIGQAGKMIFRFGVLLFILAYAGTYWLPIAVLGSVLALVGHEALWIYGVWQRRLYAPLYVQLKKGVRVLAVVPGSPADEMEIVTGDVILRVNGHDIQKEEDIYPALQQQSAFCKMEVMNKEGHIKYVQRSVYQGDHHQLGLIVAPDAAAEEYVEQGYSRIFWPFRKVPISRDAEMREMPFEQGKDVGV
jgi:hypothetical protein